MTYQSFHRAVQRMSVVSSELGVCAFEGRVAIGSGLLDTTKFKLALVRDGIDCER